MEKRADGGDESAKRVRVGSEPVRGGDVPELAVEQPEAAAEDAADEMPIPERDDEDEDEPAAKRPREQHQPKDAAEDPIEQDDGEVGLLEFGVVPSVYMLGERRIHDRKQAVHPGKYMTSASCSAKLELPKKLVHKAFGEAGAWTSTMSTRSRAVDGTLASRRPRKR